MSESPLVLLEQSISELRASKPNDKRGIVDILYIVRLHIDQCLEPGSTVPLLNMQQLCADSLVPVITSHFVEASTGARPFSHVQETLTRMVYEPKTTLSSSLPFMSSLCRSLHSLACEQWCDADGIPTSDEKTPQIALACHEARQALLKCCFHAVQHSLGPHVAAYWCQALVMLANQEFAQPATSFLSLLRASHLTTNAEYLLSAHGSSQHESESLKKIWSWCQLHIKRNMARAERLLLSSLPAHMTADGLSLAKAEAAVRAIAKETTEAVDDTKQEREHAQVRIEVQKLLNASEQLLRLGLQERALAMARDAVSLSDGYEMAELRGKATLALKQCRQPDVLPSPVWESHRWYLKLMRVAMQVLCVSSLFYFSQVNHWKLASKFTELPLNGGEDEKSSPEQKTASTWLLQDLFSAFHSVLGSPSSSHPSQLSQLDTMLASVKHKDRAGLNGEQLALLINHLFTSFVKRLLVDCLDILSCLGVHTFGKFGTPQEETELPFSVIALGSLAKLEACPFSDLEVIVVTRSDSNNSESKTESKQPDLSARLRLLMQLFQLKLVNLGESTEEDTPECPAGASRKGFSFDAKIGLAVSTDLVGTVSEVASKVDVTNNTMPESIAMRTFRCVFGSPAIAEELRREISQNTTRSKTDQDRARMPLTGLSKEFNLAPQLTTFMRSVASGQSDTKAPQQPESFVIKNVKAELYRKVCLCIDGAASYFGLNNSEVTSTWKKLDAMYRQGYLHRLYYIALKRQLNLACLLRVLSQLVFNCEKEIVQISTAPDSTNMLNISMSDGLFQALVHSHFPWWSLPDGLLALFDNAIQSFSKFPGLPADNLCLYDTDLIRDLVWSNKLNRFSQKLHGEKQGKALESLAQTSMSEGALLFVGMRSETGTRLLKSECAKELFSTNSKGEAVTRRSNRAGNADVGVLCGLVHDHIQENKACQPVLHAKHKPEYPDRAFSGGVLRQLLFGYNGFSTDFIRLRYSGKDWMIQLSESVPSVCTTHKLLSSKDFPLDTTSFTQEFLFALLLNPEDGNPFNYIAQQVDDDERTDVQLVPIDNDRIYVTSVDDTGWGKAKPRVKTILFCLPEMDKPVDAVARNQFLRVTSDPLYFIRLWFSKLESWNIIFPTLSKESKDKLSFRAGFVTYMYFVLCSIRHKLEKDPECTHRALLSFVHGVNFAKFWNVDSKVTSPLQLWEAVTSGLYDTSGKSKTPAGHIVQFSQSTVPWSKKTVKRETGYILPAVCLEELKTLNSTKGESILKQILAGDFKEFSSPWLPLNIKEAVLERLDFSDAAFTSDNQQALLRVLEEDCNYFRSLTLRNCSAASLNDATLARILVACDSQSHLQYLSLAGCKGVGKEQKATGLFSSKTSSLLYLESSCPLLKRLDISDTAVTSLKISLPHLESIHALNCPDLELFDLESPLLSAVDISSPTPRNVRFRAGYARLTPERLRIDNLTPLIVYGKLLQPFPPIRFTTETIPLPYADLVLSTPYLYPSRALHITVPVRFVQKDGLFVPTVLHSPSDVLIRALEQKLVRVRGVLNDPKPIAILKGHTDVVTSLCALDQSHFCSVSHDGTLRTWDIDTKKCSSTLDLKSGALYSVFKLTDGSGRVCVSCHDKSVQVWDLKQEKLVARLEGHSKNVDDVKQLRDGTLVSASWDSTLKIWDLKSQRCLATLEGHSNTIYAVIELSDGRLCSTDARTIKVWSKSNNSWTCVRTVKLAVDYNNALCELSPGVICASLPGNVIGLLDLNDGKIIKELKGHNSHVNCFLPLPDGRLCSSGSWDGTVRIWDLDTGECLAVLTSSDWVHTVAQLDDGRLCCSRGLLGHQIDVWDHPFADLEWTGGTWTTAEVGLEYVGFSGVIKPCVQVWKKNSS